MDFSCLKSGIKGLALAALEFVYPSGIYCIACGNLIDSTRSYALCDRCIREIRWTTGITCAKCGKQLGDSRADFVSDAPTASKPLCKDCKTYARSFRRAYACAAYEGFAASIVRDMKYRNKPWIAREIARIMCDRMLAEANRETGELPEWDLIAAAPMHIIKKRQRAYDQAELIAKYLAAELRTPTNSNILVRTRRTGVMSALSADERRANLVDAFRVKEGCGALLKEKSLLLIDDVFTTGSTVDACAETLLSAGAKSVDVLVFASGTDKSRSGLWL
jgi:ComF family protein